MMHLPYPFYHFECDVILILQLARRESRRARYGVLPSKSEFHIFELVYIHCVSKENFNVILKGFKCISLICRQIHVSFVDAMDERKIALVPVTAENSAE